MNMKTVTVNTTYTNEYQCPYCGERYTDSLIDMFVGETQTVLCDGEDGCGETFEIEVVAQD